MGTSVMMMTMPLTRISIEEAAALAAKTPLQLLGFLACVVAALSPRQVFGIEQSPIIK